MNPLAIITWITVAMTVVGLTLVWGIMATEHRRRRRPETEQRTVRQAPAALSDLQIELAEQRRALDELRSEVAQLRRQPG